jgi:sporulation protein YlmC with PRC-barrel domain
MTLRASTLLGSEVVDRQGRPLGTVSDFILDAAGPPTICYALVELRRPPDEGDITVAVPWSVLHPDGQPGRLILGVSPTALRGLKDLERPR